MKNTSLRIVEALRALDGPHCVHRHPGNGCLLSMGKSLPLGALAEPRLEPRSTHVLFASSCQSRCCWNGEVWDSAPQTDFRGLQCVEALLITFLSEGFSFSFLLIFKCSDSSP